MKILQQGTKNQVECGGCGSKLEFDLADVRLVYAPVQAGPWDVEGVPEKEDHYRAQVTCPCCSRAVKVNIGRQDKLAMVNSMNASDNDL